MSNTEDLKKEMERAAAELDLSVTTIGRLAGQGGHFYSRLEANKRVWPETVDKVLDTISRLRSERASQSEASA